MDIIEIIFYLFIFCLGTTIGSFLNVVIYRFNTGLRFDKGRSMCFNCGKTLHWYELIPLVSFIIQIGRCRGCKSLISWQYPIVEALTALVFTTTTYHLAHIYNIASPVFILYLVGYMFLFSLLIVIAAYDTRHKMIPGMFAYMALVLAVALRMVSSISPAAIIIGAVATTLPIWLLYFVSKERWMGFGDVLVAPLLGILLGVYGGLTALLLAFWIGAIYGIIIIAIGHAKGKKMLSMSSAVPFGPFLIIGLYIVYMTGWSLTTIVNWLIW